MFNIRIANTLLFQTTFILLLPYPCQNMLFKCEGRAIYQPFWFCPKQFPPRCNYSFCFEYFYVFNFDTIRNPFTLRCVLSKYLTEPQKALTKWVERQALKKWGRRLEIDHANHVLSVKWVKSNKNRWSDCPPATTALSYFLR